MIEDEKIKIINFIQDFGCCTLKQLQILFNIYDNNFKSIFPSKFISKKGDILVYNNATIDMKMIYALNVLCRYKKRLKYYHKGYEPTYITFLTKDNILYNIIVTDKINEKGVLKLLRIKSPIIPEADRFILLFSDDICFNEVVCSTNYIYCTYLELKIVQKN
jgi:hypothetical protein